MRLTCCGVFYLTILQGKLALAMELMRSDLIDLKDNVHKHQQSVRLYVLKCS